ncbi:putative subunit of proteasome, partial [Hamiltosporidium tvaerminnensis]
MSNILDFGPIYTSTGTILQINYAQKCADNGSTCIAIKTKQGIVLAVEKPITSPLYTNKENSRIKKFTDTCYTTYSGLLTDGFCIYNLVKKECYSYIEDVEKDISPAMVKKLLSSYLSFFTVYMGCRPSGCNFITVIVYNNEPFILGSQSSSLTSYYKAHAIGKGSARCKTELEKLDFQNMSVSQMIEHAVRIMYKSYDPLKDKEFDIEIIYAEEKDKYTFKEVDGNTLSEIV